jgi:hypothetical protein
MSLSCKILCTLSCVSFSLCAMEQDNSFSYKEEQNNSSITNSSAQAKPNQQYYYPINSLYKTTCQALHNYNPTDNQTVTNIFQIIDTTTKLHADGCEEKEFGKFAYNQHLVQQAPMALYISLFFEKIAQYKAHMKKNNFAPTTLEEFKAYRKIPFIMATIDKAASFRLTLNRYTIHPNNIKLLDPSTSQTDGIIEHEMLMEDIKKMLTITPEEAKIMADLFYNPKV